MNVTDLKGSRYPLQPPSSSQFQHFHFILTANQNHHNPLFVSISPPKSLKLPSSHRGKKTEGETQFNRQPNLSQEEEEEDRKLCVSMAMEVEGQSPFQMSGCCVFLPRRLSASRLGYRELVFVESESVVVVGKERRVFVVDQYVLEEEPFRILMEMMKKKKKKKKKGENVRRRGVDGRDVIFLLNVDSILFEHLLWLVDNGMCYNNSVVQLNLKEIIEFYSHDF